MAEHNTPSTLYYLTNKKKYYCEEQIVQKNMKVLCSGLCSKKVTFDLSNIPAESFAQKFRFDPFEGKFGVIVSIHFYLDGKEVSCINKTNAYKKLNGRYLFLTSDPIFWISLDRGSKLTVSYDVELFNEAEVQGLLSLINTRSFFNKKINYDFYKDYVKNCYLPKLGKSQNIITRDKEPLLFVVWDTPKGGSTLLLINILKEIIKNSKFCPVVWLINKGPWIQKVQELTDIYVLDTGFNEVDNRSTILHALLVELTKANLKNAILYNFLSCGYVKFLHGNNINTTVLVHEMPEVPKIWGYTEWVANAFKHANDVVFPSNYVKDRFISQYEVVNANCHVERYGIYNKSSLSNFDQKKDYKNKLAEQLNITKDCKIVLGCGTDSHVKGIDLFVTTAVNVIKQNNNVHFIWLGNLSNFYDNWNKVFFQMQLDNENVSKNFHFVDFVDDPSLFFDGADVYFLSSRNDTFPSTVLEAFNSFCPVVMFKDASGAQDIVNDSNGAVVPYAGVSKASKKIIKILNSSKDIKIMAENGHEIVKNLSVENYVRSICCLFANINCKEEKKNE